MASHKRVAESLVQTQAFQDLQEPTILASGQLGIYYINAEKLCQDGGEYDKHKNNSQALIKHAIQMTREHPAFREVIDILAQDAKELLPLPNPTCAIAGGQTRDWIFSGPVAYQLGLPHVSLYKNGVVDLITKNGDRTGSLHLGRDPQALIISDLITEGSSAYRTEDGIEKGWIPMLRRTGIRVNNLVAVVDRLQGARQMLQEQRVDLHTKVEIDDDFLREHSKYPERALEYSKDPTAWSENYLRQNGALALVQTFDPNGGKLPRAKAFLERYQKVLEASHKLGPLDLAVNIKYGQHLKEILGAKA